MREHGDAVKRPVLLVTDADGTLLDPKGEITDKVKTARDRFAALGGRYALATGRSLWEAGSILERLQPNAPCILMGGGMLYDPAEKRVLFKAPLPEHVRDLLRELERLDLQLSLYVYTCEELIRLRAAESGPEWGGVVAKGVCKQLEQIREPLMKIVVIAEPPVLEQVRRQFLADTPFHCAGSWINNIEIVDEAAGKGNALRRLAELLGIPMEDTFAAGDFDNDLTMLAAAGCSFAMGNASPAVRAAADHILPPNSESGLAVGFDFAAQILQKRNK